MNYFIESIFFKLVFQDDQEDITSFALSCDDEVSIGLNQQKLVVKFNILSAFKTMKSVC